MPSNSVPPRKLGKDGPLVPAIGFGCAILGSAYNFGDATAQSGPDEEQFEILDRALELGETFWDTSNVYGGNEALLGKWFRRTGKRNDIVLATKFGIKHGPEGPSVDSSPEYCTECCEASLKKMGVEYIDLYYAHRLNPQTPVERTMRAMAELKAQGKIKHIGLSEVSPTTLRRAHAITTIAAVQMEYSPFDIDVETSGLLATCRELGVAMIAYSPLGRGLLTGNFNPEAGDMRGMAFPRFQGEAYEKNKEIVQRFRTLAEKKGCTTSQLCLAWLVKQGEDVIPIPGTKRVKYLEENLKAAQVELTNEEEKEVREFVEASGVEGDRTMEAGKAYDDVDTVEE